MPKHSVITVDDAHPFAQEVIEGDHRDAGQNGRPYVSLRAPDGRVLSADPNGGGKLDWRDASTTPGAWERFIAVPGAYVIVADPYVGLVPRGGPWDQP